MATVEAFGTVGGTQSGSFVMGDARGARGARRDVIRATDRLVKLVVVDHEGGGRMTVRISRSRGRRSSIFVVFIAGDDRGAAGGARGRFTGKSATVEGKGIDRW
jgi:hypothetical protein